MKTNKKKKYSIVLSRLTISALMIFFFALAGALQAAVPVDFPKKGKPITIIVPTAPGGINDITARLIAPTIEKELGTPILIVNKPGGANQIGLTEAALAKPDGYTLVMTALPATPTVYLDPDRQAVPQIREMLPVALHNLDVGAVVVKADSPYKTVRDLVDAAKKNPEGLKASTDALMGSDHMATLYFQKQTGTRFKLVHFDGGSPATTALAGGHTDLRIGKVGSVYAMLAGGKVRIIGVMDKQRSPFVPDVPTMIEQGYKGYTWYNATGLAVPKGTPRGIIDILSNAIKKTVDTDEAKKKLNSVALIGHFMGPDEFAAYWKEFEKMIEPLVSEAKKM
jgi:tripartite-type tricarboxylate transporter receptor subunit TctC